MYDVLAASCWAVNKLTYIQKQSSNKEHCEEFDQWKNRIKVLERCLHQKSKRKDKKKKYWGLPNLRYRNAL